MQPQSAFYTQYPPPTFQTAVPSYNPPPSSYVYPQYPPYPPMSYPPNYSPLVHPPPHTHHSTYPTSRPAQTYTPTSERETFYRKLHAFRDAIGEPIQRLPTLGFKELDLCVLYKEVIKRHGIDAVIAKKQWKEVAEALQLPSSCTDSGFRLRLHYKKYLEAFERKFYTPPVQVGGENGRGSSSSGKKKRGGSASVSESAETDVGGEESVGSEEKGERRNGAIVKRKKRAGRREKKKEEEVMPIDQNDKDDGFMDIEEEVEKVEVVEDKERDAKTCQVDVVEDICDTETKEDDMEEENAERKAAHALVEAKHGPVGIVVGAIEKRRKKKRIGDARVDFSVLDCATLKRYARVHGLGYDGKEVEVDGKGVLADCVERHFSETPIFGGETEVLKSFIKAVRRR